MNPKTHAACEIAKRAIEDAKSLLTQEAETAIAANNPAELVRTYADLREEGEALRDAIADISKMERDLSYTKIPECFDLHGIQNVNVVGYGRVSLSQKWACSIIDREKGFSFLREHGQGGMIIETVNAQTLGAWAHAETEEKGREPPSEIFKTSVSRFVSLTRTK